MYSIKEEFRKLPFLKLFIPFSVGCIFGSLFPANWYISSVFAFIFLIITFSFSTFNFSKHFHFSYFWTVALLCFLFFIGFASAGKKLDNYKLPKEVLSSKAIIAKVTDIPIRTGNKIRFTTQVIYYENFNKWEKADFNCRTTLDSSGLVIKPGDVFVFKSSLSEIAPPLAPHQFDYKQYSLFHGVVCQLKVKSTNVKYLYTDNSLWYRILKLRENLVQRLTNYNFKGDERTVLSSMVLGYASEMNPDLRNAYANTGVMHILSVSGMHVGIVYYFLLLMLFFLKGNRKIELVRSVIIILALWFYALIAGFSVPVIRSAAMFSFFAIGTAFNRNGNPFNTLAASAFGILLFDPLQIFDIGFQLSYAAMAGIFLCYEPINNWVQTSSRWVTPVWNLVAVSIAATVGTLPLTLYYFHQFPVYFILTNLLVVPLSSLVLYGGLFLLIFSFVPAIYPYFAWLLDKLIYFLNLLVYKSEALPYSLIHNINIDSIVVIVLYLCVLFFLLWLKMKEQQWVFILMLLFLVLAFNFSYHSIQNMRQKHIIFYNTNQPSFSIINGRNMITLADSSEIGWLSKANENMRLKQDVSTSQTFNVNCSSIYKDTSIAGIQIHKLSKNGYFVSFNNTNILLIAGNYRHSVRLKSSLKIDYVLLPKAQQRYIKQYVENKSVQLIYFGKCSKNLDSLRKNGVYFTGSSGSFVREL